MKKSILIISTAFIFSSCVVKTKVVNDLPVIESNKYKILPEVKSVTATNRLWILFIPITIGPKNDAKRESRCLNRALLKSGGDGLANGKYVHRKFVIPLILVNYSHRDCILTAKPYKLLTDTIK